MEGSTPTALPPTWIPGRNGAACWIDNTGSYFYVFGGIGTLTGDGALNGFFTCSTN